MLAVVSMSLLSCGGGGKKDMENVKRLAHSVFDFFNNDQKDSLMILMPNVDYGYCDFLNDSIRITSAEFNKDNQHYEVQLVKHYSENSQPESNEQKSLSLEFAKAENNPFGYEIVNSKGFTKVDNLPSQLEYSGAIKENRKYSDKEYMELIKLSDQLLQEAVQKATDEINSSVKVQLCYYPGKKVMKTDQVYYSKYGDLVVKDYPIWKEAIQDSRLYSWDDMDLTKQKSNHSGEWMAIAYVERVGRGNFDIRLVNNTRYDINGGLIKFTTAGYENFTREDFNNVAYWKKSVAIHSPEQYKMTGKYDILPANTTKEYRMHMVSAGKRVNDAYNLLFWVEQISFSITADEVLKNTPMKQLFDGTEYDEFVKTHKTGNQNQSVEE